MQVGRIQNFGSWSPYLVKDGRTCLGLEYFVFEGDEHVDLEPTTTSSRRATRELEHLGLVDGRAGRGRLRRAHAEGVPDLRRDLRATTSTCCATWLAENAPNVYPVGRNGMHKYNNQDHSMFTAMLTVENIVTAPTTTSGR